MSNPWHHNPLVRMSLRELFLGVLLVAMAIVSLLYASPVWQIVMGLFVLFVFTGAIIAAIIDRGRGQSFAIGMVVAMTVYASILIYSRGGGEYNVQFMRADIPVALPTTRLLRSLARTIEIANGYAFMWVGHAWWGLLLGYVGGRFATFLYLRRVSESSR